VLALRLRCCDLGLSQPRFRDDARPIPTCAALREQLADQQEHQRDALEGRLAEMPDWLW